VLAVRLVSEAIAGGQMLASMPSLDVEPVSIDIGRTSRSAGQPQGAVQPQPKRAEIGGL
jgi:hypothetical protein